MYGVDSDTGADGDDYAGDDAHDDESQFPLYCEGDNKSGEEQAYALPDGGEFFGDALIDAVAIYNMISACWNKVLYTSIECTNLLVVTCEETEPILCLSKCHISCLKVFSKNVRRMVRVVRIAAMLTATLLMYTTAKRAAKRYTNHRTKLSTLLRNSCAACSPPLLETKPVNLFVNWPKMIVINGREAPAATEQTNEIEYNSQSSRSQYLKIRCGSC